MLSLRTLVHRIYWILAVLFISGCSGGGCSGCAGGALAPIPGGYPLMPDTRIPRSAQIRLTESGLHRVEALGPALLGGFVGMGISVPSTSTDVTVGRAAICPDGGCRINVTLPDPSLQLQFHAPNAIDANLRVIVSGNIPLRACTGNCNDRCERGSGFLPCITVASPTIVVNTRMGTHPYIGLGTRATLARDTHTARLNYHRADLVPRSGTDVISETDGEGIENADLMFTDSWISGILNLVRGPIVNAFRGQISGALGPVTDALAQSSMPNPPGCPTGTTASGARCHYSDNTNVPTLLGTDGQGNLGALLASVSPGNRANIRYVLAAGDPMRDAQVVGGGMTINMFGGIASGGHNACVPRIAPPAIPTIPEWMALKQNTVPGSSTMMDFGLGLSEDFLNYSAYQIWDAGTLCLGLGTSFNQLLNAGTFSVLPVLDSLKSVLFPATTGPVALVLRPQQPPNVRVGRGSNLMTDPLLTVRLPRMAIDFYVWSEERYVRFMTLTSDLVIPVNLEPDTGGLRPRIGMLAIQNAGVTNSTLLSNDAARIAPVLQTVLQAAIGPALGNINPVSLPDIPVPGAMGASLGTIHIAIPPTGVQGVAEGESRFLGIFANLEYRAAARMDGARLDTTATLDHVDVNPALWRSAEAFVPENLPRVTVLADTPNDFGHGAEYSARVDNGPWSSFTTDRRIVVQDALLVAPGHHTIAVRARIVGEPETADEEPALVPVTIDPIAPTLRVAVEGERVVAHAEDNVEGDLEFQFAFDDAPASAWGPTPFAVFPPSAARAIVRARDAAGNVSTAGVDLGVGTELIRGGTSTDAGSGGCGCAVVGRDHGRGSLAVLALGALGIALSRRRRRVSAPVAMLGAAAVSAMTAGCPSDVVNNQGDAATPGVDAPTCTNGMNLCRSMNRCLTAPQCPMCQPGFAPMGAPAFNEGTCAYDMASCTCTRLPPLSQGAVGSHLHMASAGTAQWLAAYSPGVPDDNAKYGDLVVGRWNSASMAVDWQHVDGVPTNGEITGDVMGWRGGVSTPGDDVGRFNSIALDAMGRPRVAYWDSDHDQLKYAAYDGTSWSVHAVDTNGHNGRYTSIALLSDGTPVIAYRATAAGMGGVVNGVVRVAKAMNATPARGSDWVITDAVSQASACRAGECPTGQACRASNGHCEATTTCPMACAAGQACFGGTCADSLGAGYIEGVPPGALYINLVAASTGQLTLVWYNRDRGNLMLSQSDMTGRFGAPTILDGEDAMGHDTGDRGIYASATRTADGVVHVAYVDGWEERLMYLRVMNGRPMGSPEVIDDGSAVGTMTFDDGRHIVGDSASIQVGADNIARVAYQDATVGTLRLGTRGAAATPMWTTSLLDSMNHTGYWASVSGMNVATYWRDLSDGSDRRWGVRVVPLR